MGAYPEHAVCFIPVQTGILRWNRFQSVLFITTGWIGVVIFVIALGLGFIVSSSEGCRLRTGTLTLLPGK